MLQGLIPSVGTVGDALDNALCETTIGLYKTECVREGSPFRTRPIDTYVEVVEVRSLTIVPGPAWSRLSAARSGTVGR